MTRKEFLKGWVLLTTQPWGARYADDSAHAQTQADLYFDKVQSMSAQEWWKICRHLAGGERWPAMDRIDDFCPTPDRHPGVEAAWARLALSLGNEALTVVWTEEMSEAYRVACGLEDNRVQARLAFKETYEALVEQARAQGKKPKWSVALGWDVNSREAVVLDAVRQGLITKAYAQKICPQLPPPDDGLLDLTKRIGNR